MSDYKVGDIVEGRQSGDLYTVRGAHDGRVWLEPHRDKSPGMMTLNDSSVRKHEPFFEVGKRYTLGGDTFEPVRVEEQSDGIMIAFGKVTSPRGFIWRMKDESVFSFWTEV